MKCQSCNAEIPPEWVNAIKSNVCPGCGEAIMQEEVVNLMNELADTISKMEFNAQEITGWLLSNYRLEKVGDGEPSGFHRPKSKNNNIKEESSVDYSPDQLERLNGFYKRSDVSPDIFQKRKKDLLKNNDFIEDEIIEDNFEEESNKQKVNADENPSSVLSSEDIEKIAKKARQKRMQKLSNMEAYTYKDNNDDNDYNEDSERSIDIPPNASPQFRAYAQSQLEKIEKARENVTSGVRLSKNAFSRSG